MYSQSLLKSKKLNSCLKIVFYNVILISKKKKKTIIIKMCYNTKKEYTEMRNMKKLIILVLLAMTVVGCELLNPKEWERAQQNRRNRGEKCYRTSSGYFYCEDRDGNRY